LKKYNLEQTAAIFRQKRLYCLFPNLILPHEFQKLRIFAPNFPFIEENLQTKILFNMLVFVHHDTMLELVVI